ncbi:MAG TPA: bifunctional 2-C-methyl-D-erythritol 4-phosphate cytidylyltransferase/2-C-methyl-D-erythritol 2,4-cyclodiphosphate synthase [Xanthobacteraceae bacterium]|nr:bifunctional 2-C-methyl-D-erythritol 4-phosphate cytidylyltransferase/2-C-methyl-D-erythritol 2,4-cyclodiphosphate synthase [Xanthobacteraceae bacterium]
MAVGVAAVIVAAGRGQRAGGPIPKAYQLVGGEPLLRHSLNLFCACPAVGLVQPVIHSADQTHYRKAAEGLTALPAVTGGATRQASVRAGLLALEPRRPEIVLVHDAARPFASHALIERAIELAAREGAAAPGIVLPDTVKMLDEQGRVAQTLDRARLRAIQTPQGFRYAALLEAHVRAAAAGRDDFTDDAALMEWAGHRVGVFEGETTNVKLTTADDFTRAEALRVAALADIRTGSGYDVHAFGAGDHLMLGGVRIASDRGLVGHSDADVALHALVDAILGALAEGDIGAHFPPSDPRWRGAASEKFLQFAVERVRARGGLLAHVDLTIICETPRIAPYRDLIRERIAAIAGIAMDRVAVKATTNEKLGFVGRSEGIAALATATIRLPWRP